MLFVGGMISSTASSSPELFEDAGSLYRGGSDGGGFSVNDFVETFMEGPEEDSPRSSGTEYPDEVYTSSDEEEENRHRADQPILKVSNPPGTSTSIVFPVCRLPAEF
jgi:hypothetical protein